MSGHHFTEGVKPGGLTNSTEIRILLCYLLDAIDVPVSRLQLEQVLLGEELVNYFAMAESLALLEEQKLITKSSAGFVITEAGRNIGRTLAHDVPRSVRDAAVRGVIRAQQYAAKKAVHDTDIISTEKGRLVRCAIGDDAGPLFKMELYMPDDLSAEAVKRRFIEGGDEVYKLVLAALTGNRELAEKSVQKLNPELPED